MINLSRAELDAQVADTIVESLALDEKEAKDLHPGTSLDKDLGIQSIDFLDIGFRVQRALSKSTGKKIQVPQEKFAVDMLDGALTSEQVQRIHDRTGQGILDEVRQTPLTVVSEEQQSMSDSKQSAPLTLGRLQEVVWQYLQQAEQQ